MQGRTIDRRMKNGEILKLALALAMGLMCAACAPQTPLAAPTSAPAPTPSPAKKTTPAVTSSAAPKQTPTAIPSPTPMTTAWQVVRPGLEFYRSPVRVNEQDNVVVAVRINPANAQFKVTYAPNAPKGVKDWLAVSGGAVAINGGFYTPQNTPLGLLISDGVLTGQTYRGFGGMFSVRDGKPALQWLAKQPYAADKKITQATQSYPMLVWGGKKIDTIEDAGRRSFRTFVGMDKQGRVILGTAIVPLWTLTDLAQYLDNEPLFALDSALNLDGGGSTGLWVNGVSDALLMDSFDPVPSVIVVTLKQ
ncbi:MAG TPA: phosphodiester glycosidase family protein [Thermoflexales bacterium]|nr:phosphodiester glycosidase family protein [Thermoflexales bacterium]HQW35903.1 phosphodiester glycosidase family protein [Thermoflexales bacterium]HQZ22110.1 phosphodiester glycosidase family protein [Thermoflexales bacterium]